MDPSWCRVSFMKETYNFFLLFKKTIYKGVCTLKCTGKRFIPPPFPPLICLPCRIKRKTCI